MGYFAHSIRIETGTKTYSNYTGDTVGAGVTQTFLDVDGRGALRFTSCASNVDTMILAIWIDGTAIEPSMAFSTMHVWGYDKTTTPIKLLEYNAGGDCKALYVYDFPLEFNSNLKITCYNAGGAIKNATVAWLYQLVEEN